MERLTIRSTNRFFLIYLLAYTGLSVLVGQLLSKSDLSMWQLILISDFILLFPVLLFLWLGKWNPLHIEGMRAPGLLDVLQSYLYAYAILPLILLINAISMMFVSNPVDDMLAALSEYSLTARLLMMAAAPALIEEFIFRGVFLVGYRRRNILVAAMMSGLLFGLIHLNFSQCAYAVLVGVAFTLLNEASGSIGTSIVAHFAINANSVLLSYGMERAAEQMGLTEGVGQVQQSPSLGMENFFLYIVLLVFAVAGIAVAIILLRSIAKRNGRWEHWCQVFRQGFVPRKGNEEKWMDIPLLVSIALALSVMLV